MYYPVKKITFSLEFTRTSDTKRECGAPILTSRKGDNRFLGLGITVIRNSVTNKTVREK